MHPILFKIGNITFYSHGLLIVLGIIAAALLIFCLSKKNDLDRTYLLDNIVYVSLIGVIGARITYFILYPHQFESASQIILLWDGGLVSYGGFVLGALALFILLKIQKQPILKWLDLYVIGLFLGLFFGRIGDWFAGDYGTGLGVTRFTQSFLPTPLLEAGLCVLIVIFSLSIFLLGKKRLIDGLVLLSSILIYSGGRFIIDFWRGEMPIFLGLSTGQIFSLIVFAISLAIFVLMVRGEKERSLQ